MFEPPHVQYARTTDHVNIAFVTMGDAGGRVPLVCLRPPHLSHIAIEWNLPFETHWHEFETLSADRLVVRFDSRGGGLSDRGVTDLSLPARGRDIESVVDRLGLERFALQGQLHSASWAVHYAAAHPERVSHLILTQAHTNARTYWADPARAALEPLAEADWETYTEAAMSNAFAWAPVSLPRALAAQMRASVDQRDFVAFLKEERTVDVTPLLLRIQCPVMVVNYAMAAVTTQEVARQIVSAVPDGRLSLPRHFREGLALTAAFLDEPPAEVPPAGSTETSGLRVFLVANGASPPGHLEQAILEAGGAPVSSLTGVTTAVFETSQAALDCGRRISSGFGVGVGIHAGEPGEPSTSEADPALVVAVRAAGVAGAGRVAVSNVVRELAVGKGFAFEPCAGDTEEGGGRLFALR